MVYAVFLFYLRNLFLPLGSKDFLLCAFLCHWYAFYIDAWRLSHPPSVFTTPHPHCPPGTLLGSRLRSVCETRRWVGVVQLQRAGAARAGTHSGRQVAPPPRAPTHLACRLLQRPAAAACCVMLLSSSPVPSPKCACSLGFQDD